MDNDERDNRPEGQPEVSGGAPHERRGGSEYGHDARQKQPAPHGPTTDNGDLLPTDEPDQRRIRISDGGPMPVDDRTYEVPDTNPDQEQSEVIADRTHRQDKEER